MKMPHHGPSHPPPPSSVTYATSFVNPASPEDRISRLRRVVRPFVGSTEPPLPPILSSLPAIPSLSRRPGPPDVPPRRLREVRTGSSRSAVGQSRRLARAGRDAPCLQKQAPGARSKNARILLWYLQSVPMVPGLERNEKQ